MKWLKRLAATLLFLTAINRVYSQDKPPACPAPEDLAPQLIVDTWARVGSGLAHNVRETATVKAAIVAQVPDGDIFRVVDGPTCADGYVWWQVDYAGTEGWM